MRTNNKRKIMIIVTIVLSLAISIGYAAIQSTLNITGTAGINNPTWNIHWENVQITSGSVSTSNANKATIDAAGTTVNYTISLPNPGDFYEFTVDAVNSGTIDGMISSVTSKRNGTTITTLPDYLEYSVKYADGIAIQENHLLAAGDSESFRVRIAYKSNIDASQMPSTAESMTFSFTVTYQQANNNAQSIRDYLYRDNDNTVSIGDSSSSLGTTYTSYEGLSSVTGSTVFLRHKIKNGLVDTAEVGFVYEGNVYYLRGGVNESGEDDKPIYEANVSAINASTVATCSYPSTRCMFSKSGTAGLANPNGQVYVSSGGLRCDITTAGESYCH